jgi:hypothetical protein
MLNNLLDGPELDAICLLPWRMKLEVFLELLPHMVDGDANHTEKYLEIFTVIFSLASTRSL